MSPPPECDPPDCCPPANILAWLNAWRFKEIVLKEGIPCWYKREGHEEAVPWDRAPALVTSELARECDRLTTENAKLKTVTGKPGWLTSEFILNAGGVVALGIVAAQGQIADLADSLGQPWGGMVNIALTVIVAGAGGSYMAKRRTDKAKEVEAKKQLVEAPPIP